MSAIPEKPHPPAHTRRRKPGLALIAPGVLVAATGVGAGDLVTAALAGAAVGAGLFWAAILGGVFKWTLNEGLARWQLGSGTTLLDGWGRHLRLHWVFLVYLLLWGFTVGGALINAAGLAGLAILPLGLDPERGKVVWGAVHSLAGVVLVLLGGFALFERVMGVCIAGMFVTVATCAVWLLPDVPPEAWAPLNPFDPGRDAMRWAVALIGGVGGTVTLLSYGYWIREEGRAGANGMRLCRIDLSIGYAMTVFFGLAVLIIAAASPEIVGNGVQLLVIIADRLGERLGEVARWMFLIGAWGAIFSSLLGVWQGVPYLFADFLDGLSKSPGRRSARELTRTWAYRGFLLYLAIPPLLTLNLKVSQIQLAYATLGALFMPLLAASLLILNNHPRWQPRAYRNGFVTNALLVLTLAFFGWTGWLELVEAMRGSAG